MRKLLIEVPINKLTCGKCPLKNYLFHSKVYFCEPFNLGLFDERKNKPLRCPACLAAEKAAKELEADHD